MNSKETRKVLIVMAGVLFVWILSPLFGFRQTDVSISTAPLQFNAARAYGSIEEFITQCPNRVFGSIESRGASAYLGDELEKGSHVLRIRLSNNRNEASKGTVCRIRYFFVN